MAAKFKGCANQDGKITKNFVTDKNTKPDAGLPQVWTQHFKSALRNDVPLVNVSLPDRVTSPTGIQRQASALSFFTNDEYFAGIVVMGHLRARYISPRFDGCD